MTMVAEDMSSTVRASTRLRPILSPSMPKNAPPTGRNAKATAKTAKVWRRATTWSPSGKKTLAMMGARKP